MAHTETVKVTVKGDDGLPVRRAGIVFQPGTTEVPVTAEQFRGLKADDRFEVSGGSPEFTEKAKRLAPKDEPSKPMVPYVAPSRAEVAAAAVAQQQQHDKKKP